MNDLKIILIAFLGLISGAIFGFIAPLLICYGIDAINNPPPGSGLMTAGWVFCFITIPLFAIIGCIWSGKIAIKKFKSLE